jgi:hypothetical protein
MTRVAVFFILTTTCFLREISAQTVIEGFVRDFSGSVPIERAMVVLSDKDGSNIIAYTITNDDGFYSIRFSSGEDTLKINISILGYKPQSKLLYNKSQQTHFSLSQKIYKLKEVLVKAPPIITKGDTTIYRVESFLSPKDRVIGDVLKNIPGVEVTDAGGILYNGTSISHFYIEGLDLLGGKYGIATNNIPSVAVQNVEVITNYEPIKALRGFSDSDKTVINLKLKKEKLIRPFGTASAGIGGLYDFLRDIDVFAMNVSPESQTIITGKTNNVGVDLRDELTDFSAETSASGIKNATSSPLNGDLPGYPPTGKNRALFNDTHSLTFNSLKKLSEDKQVKVNASYVYDKTKQRAEQQSYYFLQDSALYVYETKSAETKSNELELSLHFKNNADRSYLNNLLNGKISLVNAHTDVLNGNMIYEKYKLPDYLLENNLQYMRRKNVNVFALKSYVRYSSLPQRMDIHTDATSLLISQRASLSGFYTKNESSISRHTHTVSLGLVAAAEASFENLNTELISKTYTDSLKNDLSFDYAKAELIPSFRYHKGKYDLNLKSPSVYQYFFMKDDVYNDKKNRPVFFVNPSISLNYKFNPLLNMTANIDYRTSYGAGILDYTNSYLALNYRSLRNRSYSGIMRKMQTGNSSITVHYRNMLKFFSAYLSASYSSSQSNVINDIQFNDGGRLSVSANKNIKTQNDNWIYRIHSDQYIPLLKGKIALSASYSISSSQKMQQSVIIPLKNNRLSLMPECSFKIHDLFEVGYKYIYSGSYQKIETISPDSKYSSYHVMSHDLSVYYFIRNKLSANISAEYLRNPLHEDTYKKLLFVDIGLKYKLRNTEITLSCHNLFNHRKYVYTSQYLDTYIYSYDLRPAGIMAKIIFNY